MENELIFPADRIPALPYAYEGSDFQISVVEQVAEYCGYELRKEIEKEVEDDEGNVTTTTEVINPDGETYENMWKRIWLAIRYLSLLTCWTDGATDTFITQTRKQSFRAMDACGCNVGCSCEDDAIIIPLEYAPRPNQPWVYGSITTVVDGKPITTEIPAKYLYEHTDPTTDLLYIVRSDFPEVLYRYGRCCFTNRKLTITLEYNAGYDFIPEGLLAAICPILSKLESAKVGLNDCASAMTQTVGLLKRKKVGNTEYEWSDRDAETQKTQVLFTDIFDVAILSEIEAISRCNEAEGVEAMGDVV